MQAPTKKRHTDDEQVTLELRVQKRNVAKIKAFIKDIETEGRNYTIAEVFPDLQENKQGVTLRGYRTREGYTQKQLAELSGIPQRHISEMETGKRPLGKENAKRMSAVLNTDYRAFL